LILGMLTLGACMVSCYKSNQHQKFLRRLAAIRGNLGTQRMVFTGQQAALPVQQQGNVEMGNRRSLQYYVNTLQQRMSPSAQRQGAVYPVQNV